MKTLAMLALLGIALLALSSCNSVRDEVLDPLDDLPDAQGYYSTQSGNFLLRYKVVGGNTLECVLRAATDGWLAVGFAPTSMMKDANFIIGYVSGNNGYIRDDWGISSISHASDLSQGGTNDVILLSADDENGFTTLRFTLPLDSGDSKDRALSIGSSYPVIFASGLDDDFDSYHESIGSGTIRIRSN